MTTDFTVNNSEQRKIVAAGGTLLDVLHVDYIADNGMVGFVDVPLAQATPDAVKAAILAKIDAMDAILALHR
jgi:hypothetical protein